MSTAVEVVPINPAALWFPVAVSPASDEIKESVGKYREDWQIPVTFAWRNLLFQEIFDILQDCSVHGWDGYDSEPVSPDTANGALELLKNLPEGIQMPAVVPEPGGDIAFEWRTDDGRHFSLSVTGPTLVYAGVFGGFSKQYGEERFFGPVPRTILEILVRYFPLD